MDPPFWTLRVVLYSTMELVLKIHKATWSTWLRLSGEKHTLENATCKSAWKPCTRLFIYLHGYSMLYGLKSKMAYDSMFSDIQTRKLSIIENNHSESSQIVMFTTYIHHLTHCFFAWHIHMYHIAKYSPSAPIERILNHTKATIAHIARSSPAWLFRLHTGNNLCVSDQTVTSDGQNPAHIGAW